MKNWLNRGLNPRALGYCTIVFTAFLFAVYVLVLNVRPKQLTSLRNLVCNLANTQPRLFMRSRNLRLNDSMKLAPGRIGTQRMVTAIRVS